jgi:hypothetical protein
MPLEQELLAIEKELWTGGPETYRRHTDDQCLVVFAEMAGIMSKDDIARSAEQGRWRDVACTPKGLVELAGDTAIIAYECTATRKDGHRHRALVSSAYRRRAGGWKLAFHQQTAQPQATE